MGERIAALAALNRVRAAAAQLPAQSPFPAASPVTAPATTAEAAPQQAVNNITGSRTLQEIAGLRQMAETTSQGITPNINGQRADVIGSALSQQAESTVSAPNATEARQPAADVVAANTRNRLSFNRAILETLRGGFEVARENVPTVEEQMTAIREALAARRSETQRVGEEERGSGAGENAPLANVVEADALELLAEAPSRGPVRAPESPYPASGGPVSGGGRLNFLI